MHSDWLHRLFLDSALARGQARLDGCPINLADTRVPILNVGTVQGDVAPWRSVFKLHTLTDAQQTFVLTAGGHNVRIVSPPGQAPTSHRLWRWQAGTRLLTPDDWLATTPPVDGSRWLPWFDWLRSHSQSGRGAPPTTRRGAASLILGKAKATLPCEPLAFVALAAMVSAT